MTTHDVPTAGPASDDAGEQHPHRYTAALANEIEARWQERWERAGWFDSLQSFWDDFREDGRQGAPYRPHQTLTIQPNQATAELCAVANFAEVWLAKQGHDGLVGINFLEKIQMGTPTAALGAVLASGGERRHRAHRHRGRHHLDPARREDQALRLRGGRPGGRRALRAAAREDGAGRGGRPGLPRP